MKSTSINSNRQLLPLSEAQIRALKHSTWNDLQMAIDACEPIRQEWSWEFRNCPFSACGIAYMAGMTAGVRLERARRNR